MRFVVVSSVVLIFVLRKKKVLAQHFGIFLGRYFDVF